MYYCKGWAKFQIMSNRSLMRHQKQMLIDFRPAPDIRFFQAITFDPLLVQLSPCFRFEDGLLRPWSCFQGMMLTCLQYHVSYRIISYHTISSHPIFISGGGPCSGLLEQPRGDIVPGRMSSNKTLRHKSNSLSSYHPTSPNKNLHGTQHYKTLSEVPPPNHCYLVLFLHDQQGSRHAPFFFPDAQMHLPYALSCRAFEKKIISILAHALLFH